MGHGPPPDSEAQRVAAIAAVLRRLGQSPDLTDDCARLYARTDIVSCDTLVEGVHFDRRLDTLPQIGAQAAVSNLSDLAGSGGAAGWAMWALSLPPSWSVADLTALAEGFVSTLVRHGARLVGGNLTSTAGPATINVTVGGPLAGPRALTRDGARAGDVLYVTGPLGDGALGWLRPDHATRAGRHRWRPHLAEARALARCPEVSACMDISDGLLKDAGRLGDASGVSIHLTSATLPVSDLYRSRLGGDLKAAISGGEDYVLLFALPGGRPPPCRAWAVGRCAAGPSPSGGGLHLDDRPVAVGGFDHFQETSP